VRQIYESFELYQQTLKMTEEKMLLNIFTKC